MRTCTALILLLFFIQGFCQESGNSGDIYNQIDPKFPFESGQITYEVSGDAKGSSILYFDRNGWRSSFVQEVILENYGITSLKKTMELVDGDWIYKINLKDSTGKKSTDKNWSSLRAYKGSDDVVAALMEKDGGELSGEEELLGFNCRIWVFSNGPIESIWEYQGIPLKITKNIPGYSYSIIATDLQTTPPPENVFSLPEGVSWN